MATVRILSTFEGADRLDGGSAESGDQTEDAGDE
jgi:hypothetical protein